MPLQMRRRARGLFFWSFGARGLSWVKDKGKQAEYWRRAVAVCEELHRLEPALIAPDAPDVVTAVSEKHVVEASGASTVSEKGAKGLSAVTAVSEKGAVDALGTSSGSRPRLRWRARAVRQADGTERWYVFYYLPAKRFSDRFEGEPVEVTFTLKDGQRIRRTLRPDTADWFVTKEKTP